MPTHWLCLAKKNPWLRPWALLKPNIFFIFLWKYFLLHIKPEGITQCDVFHTFVENSVKSEFLFFWALLKGAKIWNSSKVPIFGLLKDQVLVNSKNFDPSLERSWCELFKMIKSLVQKTHPTPAPGWNWSSPYLVISKNEILGVFCSFIQRSLIYCVHNLK